MVSVFVLLKTAGGVAVFHLKRKVCEVMDVLFHIDSATPESLHNSKHHAVHDKYTPFCPLKKNVKRKI